VGLEYARRFSKSFVVEGGVGFDMLSFPLTGDKPGIDDFGDSSFRLGAAWEVSDNWRIRGGAGKKSRFPIMRELFGTALNRFLLNPDLKPERVSNVEIGVERRWQAGYLSLTPFFQDVEDTIDQRAVGPLRQRINLKGSTVHGVELDAFVPLADCWSLSGTVTWAEARRKRTQPSDPEFIAEKPEVIAHALLRYQSPSGFEAGAELEHFGRAYSLGPTGAFVPLAISTQLNLSAAYRFDFGEAAAANPEIYLRVDNVTDEFVEPQAGLPAAGRWWRAGVRFGL
jgi:iron complex outermembrane receptor protein